MVTNGDNDYDSNFFSRLLLEGKDSKVDAVAFDYYSRFQRPTGEEPAAAHLKRATSGCARSRRPRVLDGLPAQLLRLPNAQLSAAPPRTRPRR